MRKVGRYKIKTQTMRHAACRDVTLKSRESMNLKRTMGIELEIVMIYCCSGPGYRGRVLLSIQASTPRDF